VNIRLPLFSGLLLATCAFAAPAPASPAAKAVAKPLASKKTTDQVRAAAPIKNFRLPTFTVEGYREFMLRAGEAMIPDPSRIDVREMDLTVFTRDAEEQIDARLTAPSATFLPNELIARGSDTMRMERADLTVTGAGWTYDHKAQKLTITRDAHIIFRAPIGDVIK
jgi:hypothetical protein